MSTNWKDPIRAARLKVLWNEGHSAGTIARMMGGITRNSVIGAVSRAGLPSRATTTRTKYPNRKRRLSREGANSRPNASEIPPRPRLPTAPLPVATEYDRARVSFLDLDKGHCRFPVGDPQVAGHDKPLFCGERQHPGLVYCAVHARRAYAPPQPRRPDLRVVAGKELQVA
jgi:GcrA cell cycle regulator